MGLNVKQRAILILAICHWKAKRKRSLYMRDILKRRLVAGEMNLVKEMATDPQYHFRYFRMSRENFLKLLSFVGPELLHSKRHLIPIGPEERLAITLRYLASGDSQSSLSFSYRISPTAVSNILRETLSAIWKTMVKQYVPSPTLETYKKTADCYWNKWNFPNCLGSVDGKHVKIQCPSNTGSDFFNYKGYFSIVILAIADAEYKFSVVDIGAKGSQSDSGIFGNSSFGGKLYRGELELPKDLYLPNTQESAPFVFLGDEAFPLHEHLLRPYPGKNTTLEQRVFNYRLCRARRIVENTFGIWAARFRIFYNTINADLKLADLIVKATVVLHNFLMDQHDLGDLTMDQEKNGVVTNGNWRAVTQNDSGLGQLQRVGSNNRSNVASSTREKFKDFFNCESGSVHFQYDCVNFFQDIV